MNMRWITRIAILLATIPFMAFSCYEKESPNCHKRIAMTNCSAFPILIYDTSHGINHPFDDNLRKEVYDQLKDYKNSFYPFIQPQKTEVLWDVGDYSCLEGNLKYATLAFYILDPEIIDEFTAEELTDGRAILEVQRFTLEDLHKTGGNIVYR